MDEQKQKEQLYKILVQRGRQDLRFSVLVFSIITIGIFGFQLYLIYLIVGETLLSQEFLLYLLRILVSAVLWFIALKQLWKYRNIGRILYILVFALSMYGAYELWESYTAGIVLTDKLQLYYYGFLGLAVIHRLLAFYYLVKFFHRRSIRSIWSIYDMFDEDLQEEDISDVFYDEEDDEPEEPLTIPQKARKHLRTYAGTLGLFLYCYCIVTLMVVAMVKGIDPLYEEGLELVQYYLFLGSLFSMLLWAAPLCTLYLYKGISRMLLIGACVIELLRMVLFLPNYMKVAESLNMPFSIKLMYFAFEFCRIVILIYGCLRMRKDAYIYAYWKHVKAIESYENKKQKRR